MNNKDQKNKYTGAGIALGPAFGLLVGLLFLDNIILGMGIGVAFGLIVGAMMDAEREKNNIEK